MNPPSLFAQHFVNEQETSPGRRLTVQELLTDNAHNISSVHSGNINVSSIHNHSIHDRQHNYQYPPPTPQIHDVNTIHEHNNHLSARAVDSASTTSYFRPVSPENRNGYSKLLPRPLPNDELEDGGSYESSINHNYVTYVNDMNISTHDTHSLSPTSPSSQYTVMPPTSPATPVSPNQQLHATIPLSEQRERNKIASAKYRKKKQQLNQEMSTRINEMNSKISSLETENTMLRRQLEEVKGDNQELRNTIDKLKSKLAKDKIFKRLERASVGKSRKIAGVNVMSRKG